MTLLLSWAHQLFQDAKVMVLTAIIVLGKGWRSPGGLRLRAWARANPALAVFLGIAAIYLLGVILPVLDGLVLFHAGHKTFTLFDLIIGGALVAFVAHQWGDGLRLMWQRQSRPRTIEGQARTIVDRAKHLAGKDGDK